MAAAAPCGVHAAATLGSSCGANIVRVPIKPFWSLKQSFQSQLNVLSEACCWYGYIHEK